MAQLDTPAQRQGRLSAARQLGVTACILIALLAGLYGSTPVFTPRTWLLQVGLFVAIVACGTTAVRVRTSNDVLATLAGLAFGAVGLVTCFGSESAGVTLPLIPSSWSTLIDHFDAAGTYLTSASSPAQMTPQTLVVVMTVAVVLYVVMDALAIGLGYPLVGISVAAVGWIPALALEMTAPVWPAAVIAIAGLVAAQVQAWSSATSGLWTRRGAMTAAAVIGALLIAPALPHIDLIKGGGSGSSGSGSWSSDDVRLIDDLDLTAHLGARSLQPMLTYHATSNYPVDRIRVMTVESFDGRRWNPGPGREGFITGLTGDEYLWEPGEFEPEGDPLDVTVTIKQLRTNSLPIPVGPTRANANGQWHVDLDSGVVTSQSGDLDMDSEYSFTYYRDALDYDTLNEVSWEPGLDFDKYLALPDDPYLEILREYAEDVTADATTQLEQAVALQNHFRTGPNFSYSFTVGSPVTSNAVFDFLSDGQGYCVQFSSAMATLARSLGIPARIGIGFLSGSRLADGGFVVRGEDAHAWPELYFEGIGWVPFEPTPAVQTGTPPAWTIPDERPATPTPTPTETRTATPTPTTQAPTPSATTGTDTGRLSLTSLIVIWVLGLALLGVMIAVVILLVRRHRYGPITASTVEDTYDQLRRRLSRIGAEWSDHTPVGQVPEEVVETLAATVLNRSRARRELGDARSHLQTWASLTQQHWYSEEEVDVAAVTSAANKGWLAVYDWYDA